MMNKTNSKQHDFFCEILPRGCRASFGGDAFSRLRPAGSRPAMANSLPSPTQQATPPVAQTQTPPVVTEAPAVESAAPVEAPASDVEPWKVEFEKSQFENYGVTPEYYEDLGDGIYQVYVKIDGKLVPYVAVDSATGDYHG